MCGFQIYISAKFISGQDIQTVGLATSLQCISVMLGPFAGVSVSVSWTSVASHPSNSGTAGNRNSLNRGQSWRGTRVGAHKEAEAVSPPEERQEPCVCLTREEGRGLLEPSLMLSTTHVFLPLLHLHNVRRHNRSTGSDVWREICFQQKDATMIITVPELLISPY